MLDRVLRSAGLPDLRAWLAVGAMALMLYHAQLCRTAFHSYAGRPYPALASELTLLAEDPATTRIVTVAAERSIDPTFLKALPHNLPTVYDVSALRGYGPQVARRDNWRELLQRFRRDPVETLRDYGVTHAIVHRSAYDDVDWKSPFASEEFLSYCADREPAAEGPGFTLHEFHDATPRAFTQNERAALPVRVLPGAVEVDVSGLRDQRVVVNYLFRENTSLRLDGQMVAGTADRLGRITVHIPAGTSTLRVGHEYPGSLALAVAAATMLAGTGLLVMARRRSEKLTDATPQCSTAWRW
ncbi:MAG: hypothetical protein GF393_07335 [Armatimonadia bacterium]|nr:hypothetical protein [Armatimonadia bacterium]